ncbi:MAG: iron-containing alcohol dehydrogenase [Patescibacteria group bacterium]
MIYEIGTRTKVIFGVGAFDQLGERARMRGKKALLVSYKGFLEAQGLAERIDSLLRDANVEYVQFDEVTPEPDCSVPEKGRDALKEHGCDMVIAVGGGSVLDTGKHIALLAANGGTCGDFLDPAKILFPSLPLLAVPTTAGTGSEVTMYAVFSDKKQKRKFTIKSEMVCPWLALVDPLLTVNLPKGITGATGLDALVHCIEGYLNTQSSLYSKTLALLGMRIILTTLPKVFGHPEDVVSREQMMLAGTIGGLVITNARTGVVHTMSAAMEPHGALSHGEVVGRILPHVLKFYREQNAGTQEMREMHHYVYGESISDSAVFIEHIEGFVKDVAGTLTLEDQRFSPDLKNWFVERVLMDKGLPGVSLVPIEASMLQRLLEEVCKWRDEIP